MHVVLASDLGGVRTIPFRGTVSSSESVLHFATIVKRRRVAVCKAQLFVSWPNPLQRSKFPPQVFDRGRAAVVAKTAWQTAAFSCQKGPVVGNLILSSLIPGN